MTRYCVRPNSGRIEVGSEVEVQGIMTSNIATKYQAKDKTSPPSGNERRPTTRRQMPRQVPSSIRRHHTRERYGKCYRYCQSRLDFIQLQGYVLTIL